MNGFKDRLSGRLSVSLGFCLAAILATAGSASGQSLEALVKAYLSKPTPVARGAVLQYAEAHPRDPSGALALLVAGYGEANSDQPRLAVPRLAEAKRRLPELADYAAFHLARARHRSGEPQAAIDQLQEVVFGAPPSPLRVEAIMLAGEIYLASGLAIQGAALLLENLSALPQPAGLALLARCQETAGDLLAAAGSFQRIYYEYPVSAEAKLAGSATARLRERLGSRYPPAMAQAMFTRVERLIAAGRHEEARGELQHMTERLGGAARDPARVWLGKARHLRRHDDVAFRWLSQLRVSDADANAERLYWLLESARRLGRTGDVMKSLGELESKHPRSPWRLQALVSAGNMYLLLNDHERHTPIYAACAESFPGEEQGAYCDWKVVWSHYIRRQPGAPELLRRHLERFPGSAQASAALYYLGRSAEDAGDLDAARTYFAEVTHEYPLYYYAALADQRLTAGRLLARPESPSVRAFLDGLTFPRRRHTKDFEPDAATELRLRRARLLLSAGLFEWAERELRFGARTDAKAPLLAMELAQAASREGEHGRGLRHIKGLAAGYLSVAIEDAPDEFWRLAFPLPYRDSVQSLAAKRELDPHFLAALIRQESEFDVRARSRAGALGLTQILPATGRELSRKLGIRGYNPSMLYRADVNLNMGAYYLRQLLDEFEGYAEAALASYNAGRSRVHQWLTWAEFREPAEFVETIPFTETRNYVQTVMRNAEIYRRLYGPDSVARR